MDNPGYIALTRMKGLHDEIRAVANNVANASTTGFRGESLIFAEVLQRADVDGGALAMSAPRAHYTDAGQGGLTATGGQLDLAIEGEGYFMVQTPGGQRLTRAGAFMIAADGSVQDPRGNMLLDAGGAPLQLPPEARSIQIGADGSVSADGLQLGQVGLFDADPTRMLREDGVLFRVDGPTPPSETSRIAQGYLEQSNVNAVEQMARLIEVHRAYEMGQSLMDMEDRRQRSAVETIGRTT
jgi:flagellar basal-body rod protein FlgF